MKTIGKIFHSTLHVFRQMRWWVKILLLVVIVIFFSGGAIVITGQPGFCNSCHIMDPYYESWENSSHSSVNCLDCHLQPGFTGYVKGKVNGLAQLVDCVSGRVGTKPNAVVEDASCMRSECHSTEELETKNLVYSGMKFTHQTHVKNVVDGIKISCNLCHSYVAGEEHFSVNKEVCFTCHFLKGSKNDSRIVKTECQSCHEVPNKVIKRGFVTIDHAEFVSYKASCDDSCHKKEIEKDAQVSATVCLNCHDYVIEREPDSVKLHEVHTDREKLAAYTGHKTTTHAIKVECFACHGKVIHERSEVTSVAAMMDCQDCHSNTHEVQRSIYTGDVHPQDGRDPNKVLSPMFLTHVECKGCHIERVRKSTGALDSFGEVAKVVPESCDKCHEPGTGAQYIPFWQGKTKGLYEQIVDRTDRLQQRAQLDTDPQSAQKSLERVKQARAILESVANDGSWGVHNFKYTEAMLLRANELVIGTE
ncbi:MAG: NapC/NirT family cytochrome c [Phycisphaerales bacterium]|nr:MAG: NapC/NirT family cytochrome c [Phycisphaerales bacterium]